MGNLSGFIDPTAELPKAGGALPAGWYLATIIESELRDNYSKDGEEHQFTYEVLEGDQKGRKFWHTIAKSGDPSRVGKGQGEINAIIAATGVANPGDTRDLHYKPHWVRLSFVAAGTKSSSGNTYQKDRNFLNEWKPAEGGLGNAPATGTASTAAASGASPSSPPWQRAA